MEELSETEVKAVRDANRILAEALKDEPKLKPAGKESWEIEVQPFDGNPLLPSKIVDASGKILINRNNPLYLRHIKSRSLLVDHLLFFSVDELSDRFNESLGRLLNKVEETWIAMKKHTRKDIHVVIRDGATGKSETIILDREKVEAEKKEFMNYVKHLIEVRSGKEITLTGGPYRGYDIQVELTDKRGRRLRKPRVDIYTPMRTSGWDSPRVMRCIEWAVKCIKENRIVTEPPYDDAREA